MTDATVHTVVDGDEYNRQREYHTWTRYLYYLYHSYRRQDFLRLLTLRKCRDYIAVDGEAQGVARLGG